MGPFNKYYTRRLPFFHIKTTEYIPILYHKLQTLLRWVYRHWPIVAILLLAAVLRFYNFENRVFFFGETARDLMVTRQAVKKGILPLIGTFSSAGPFVFGPTYYWVISLPLLFSQNSLELPFVLLGVFSIIFVATMYLVGATFADKKLGLILAFLAAVSPAQIERSLSLTQHTLIGVESVFSLLLFMAYLKKPKLIKLFFLGLVIGLSLGTHTQAINLLLFCLVIFYPLSNIFSLKMLGKIIIISSGIILPLLPFAIWDWQLNFANFRNILDYFLIAQYRFFVSRRWLTYLFDFWPSFWSQIVGGNTLIGFLAMIISPLALLSSFRNFKKAKQELFFLGLIFITWIWLLRYYRNVYLEGYLLYFHSLVIFWTGFALYQFKRYPTVLVLMLLIFIIPSLQKDIKFLKNQKSDSVAINKIVNLLQEKFPQEKFTIFDSTGRAKAISLPLSLILDIRGLNNLNAHPIGLCIHSCEKIYPALLNTHFYGTPFEATDLKKSPKIVAKPTWEDVSPQQTFLETLYWWKTAPLATTFSLKDYILEAVKIKK